MWFWRRREVYHGFSVKEQAQTRQVLADNKIKYDYKVISMNGQRVHGGSFGINKEYENEYYIYVDKNQYDNAIHLLS